MGGKTTICPKCGRHLLPFRGFTAGLIYECKNCGYRGPLALDEKSKKAPKNRI